MANEAELFLEYSPAIPMTVANATAITKGAVLKLTDPFTASSADGDNDLVAGIAKEDKIASDGHTKIAVYRSGVFRMFGSGTITIGDPVGTLATYTNYVQTMDMTGQTLSGARCLGIALESSTNGQSLWIELRPSVVWPSI